MRANPIRIAAILLTAATAAQGQTPVPAHIGLAHVAAEDYGRQLITQTFAFIGPEVADPAMRYAGNNLSCQNCHLDAGTKAYALALTGVYAKYPRPDPADGRIESLGDRINQCMTRSMNGRPLPETGPEMTAILAYLELIAADAGSFGNPPEEPAPIPAETPDPARGARLYAGECAACHQTDGLGLINGQPGQPLGYLRPPLWGPDSFNAAAGMARLPVAANFIHAHMPLGSTPQAPVLLPRDAWDIAAYVLSQPRPPAPDQANPIRPVK